MNGCRIGLGVGVEDSLVREKEIRYHLHKC